MTLQQLQYFLATLEHGSFTEAAAALHLAQRQLLGGIATFGTFGAARHFPTGEIIAEFRRRHPAVRVRMIGLNSAQVAEAVREGDLEAGLVALPVDDEGLEVRPIMRDEILLCTTDAARLRKPVRASELGDRPLILADASYRQDDPTRRQLRALAQEAGVTLRAEIEVEDDEIALELAAGSIGDVVVLRGVLHALGRRVPRRLGWVPFREPLEHTFALVSRRGATLSPASREFFALAEERLTAFAETLKARTPRKRAPQVTGS